MSTGARTQPRMVVVFRNDDPSACSDVEHERQVAAIFEKYGVPQTIGVVPHHATGDTHDPDGTGERPLDSNPAMVGFLREYLVRSGSEVALHGYTHRTSCRSQPSRREYFEFRRLGAAEQASLIRRGSDTVERALGVRPSTFIPPWNRLDRATLQACAETGYRLVSAGPFTEPAGSVLALGTDCSTDQAPALVAAAQDSPDRVLLRVLYHSPTTRTREELAALERAVRCAVETEGCEVLTLAEAVRRYPDDVRLANEAARNVVPQDEVPGSPRARAVVYRRALVRLGAGRELESLYARARDLYRRGRYTEACALSPRIDRRCRRVLALGRTAAGLAGCSAGLMLGLALSGLPASARLAGYAVAGAVGLLGGVAARWRMTAEDSKREVWLAARLALLAGAAGIAIVSWLAP